MRSMSARMRPSTLARATATSASLWALLVACTHPVQRKPIEMAPIGTVPKADRAPKEEGGDGGTTTPNSGTPSAAKEAACTGGDFEDLGETLKQCEAITPRAGDLPPGIKEKLEIRVNAATLAITPGGRVDLTITFRNKSSEPLPLFFTLDPMPRFDIETVDTKGKRVDVPAGKPPKSAAPASGKTARIILNAGGTARYKLGWDATKQKWAPERAATWAGKGPPRASAGPLPNGKYVLRILIPMVAVFERGDLDVPKFPIEVGS